MLQNDSGGGRHAAHLPRHINPFLFLSVRPYSREQRLKVGIAIKDQPFYKGGEAFVLDIAQPADALALRYGVVVQIFQIRYVLDKCPGALAGNCNPAAGQLCDLIGVGQYRLADDKPAP